MWWEVDNIGYILKIEWMGVFWWIGVWKREKLRMIVRFLIWVIGGIKLLVELGDIVGGVYFGGKISLVLNMLS